MPLGISPALTTVMFVQRIAIELLNSQKSCRFQMQNWLSFAKTREKLLRCHSRLIVVFVFGPGPSFFFRLQCLNLATRPSPAPEILENETTSRSGNSSVQSTETLTYCSAAADYATRRS